MPSFFRFKQFTAAVMKSWGNLSLVLSSPKSERPRAMRACQVQYRNQASCQTLSKASQTRSHSTDGRRIFTWRLSVSLCAVVCGWWVGSLNRPVGSFGGNIVSGRHGVSAGIGDCISEVCVRRLPVNFSSVVWVGSALQVWLCFRRDC